MKKIYYSIINKKYVYMEESEINDKYIELRRLRNKICLIGDKDILFFDSLDIECKNKYTVKKYLQLGYTLLLDSHKYIVADMYNICPYCGEDIDIHTPSSVCILDAGIDFTNIACDNLYPAKEIICPNCNKSHYYSYEQFSGDLKKNIIDMISTDIPKSVFIKYRHIVDKEIMAYIPISINLKNLKKIFRNDKKSKEDMVNTINNEGFKGILNIIANPNIIQEFGEIKFAYDNIKFLHPNFIEDSEEGFKKIDEYQNLSKEDGLKLIYKE